MENERDECRPIEKILEARMKTYDRQKNTRQLFVKTLMFYIRSLKRI